MRVLLVSKGLDIGGIERIVVDLALGLHKRGVSVEVAVVNDCRDQLVSQLEQGGVIVCRLGGSDRIGIGAAWRLARLMRAGRFDVVHVHGPLPTLVARCVPGGPPVVTTSHTLWSGIRPPTRILWGITAFRDSRTLAVSSAVAESLPPRITRRTLLFPHGVDVQATDDARSRAGSHAGGPVVAICVASHRDVKNYPNLLNAFAIAHQQVPELRLVAVGDGPERSRHRRLADDLGLSEAVSFIVATTEILDQMTASDFLVVASDFEGQPMVVMEAMAVGLPVVATAVGRVPELITPAEGSIVPPGDAEALASAIVEMASDADTRRAMGERARLSSRMWTLDQVIDAHIGLYDSI